VPIVTVVDHHGERQMLRLEYSAPVCRSLPLTAEQLIAAIPD
jgi:hypothetical protein